MPENATPEIPAETPLEAAVAAEVTAAGIARLAGVGRAAVSNWRRRHADFPKPVGGTEASPAFDLTAVERWLRDQGKLAEVPLRERVWQQVMGHPAGAAVALRHVGAVLLLVRDRPAVWRGLARAGDDAELTGLLPPALDTVLTARLGPAHPVTGLTREALAPSSALVRAAAELAEDAEGAPQAYEFLLGRHLDANPRQYTLTPPGLAALMAELAGPATTVLDPAAGTGTLLQPPRDPAAGDGTYEAAGDGTCEGAGDGAYEEAGGGAYERAAPGVSDRGAAGSAGESRGGPGGSGGGGAPLGPAALYGQEADADLAALTALRLALRSPQTQVRVQAADTLRADAFPDLAVDAVLTHPPFNERNWGHDTLAYDPRWEYGFPARTESELAWVQHALARLKVGGTAVLLMPPAAASRRSGRRIRADLLRRGALRAVIALPAGAAPPYGIPLHLWVLHRPDSAPPPAPHLLVVDTAELAPGGRDKLDWQTVRATVLDAWRAFDHEGGIEERPGVRRALAAIDLLDDDVDLAPARHLPPPAAAGGPAELARAHEELTAALDRTAELAPPPVPAGKAAPARWPLTTVGELARAGALLLRAGGPGTAAVGEGPVQLTEHDVIGGMPPSGTLPEPAAGDAPEDPVLLRAGDVVVPVLGGGAIARVVDPDTEGAALGRNLFLLRPEPAALDPWFLAGFLRGTANNRQASSYASTATRLDVRRLQLPRLPPAEQRAYGERFRALAAFEAALRDSARLGERLTQGLYDGLTDGSIPPD
ncbi:N-6 DNA methylase [Streptomyces sclerotialus]|uniref:HsdM family class I SAM-dependent methyltransferase n=1 Tax=Streptomyces sclerotialus TaxID=1957 RepID=UPI0004C62697